MKLNDESSFSSSSLDRRRLEGVAADRDWLGSSQDSGCEICDSWHFGSDIKKYYDGKPFGFNEDPDPRPSM
jgi:hypothetical protein